MALDIHLYLTTKKDALPDLDSFKHADEVRSWFSQVKNVALHHNRFTEISDELIAEAEEHHILEAFAIIFYPPGEMLEADDQIGEKLDELFTRHKEKFSWSLTCEKNLEPGKYDVYLELIVESQEGEGEQPEVEKSVPAVGSMWQPKA